jgi:uncharacterized protein Yka (UPF0111/DUF47 family)
MVSLRLMPRDVKFFELFIADGDNLLAAARELNDLVSSYDQLDERIARIQALEHAGDEIGDVIAERLDQAFLERGSVVSLDPSEVEGLTLPPFVLPETSKED